MRFRLIGPKSERERFALDRLIATKEKKSEQRKSYGWCSKSEWLRVIAEAKLSQDVEA